ncbi:MAG: hypothetical protein HYZ42_13970 [Bacteroidetes bacterium]|nr:hypothetical protein [Bacteroidota bacterium]
MKPVAPLFMKKHEKLTFEDLKTAHEQQTNVPFKIIGITDKGFYGCVSDFKAFISFKYMPFSYVHFESWLSILPHLKHRFFYAKIHSILNEDQYFILNANIPQFKHPLIGKETICEGVIIQQINHRSIQIELGAFFGWKFGSIIGIMTRSKRDSLVNFRELKCGDKIKAIIYDKSTEESHYLLKGSVDYNDWEDGSIKEMLHKIVQVRFVYFSDTLKAVVCGKHQGKILTTKKLYAQMYMYSIYPMVRSLNEQDCIQCKVVRVNESTRRLDLLWLLNDVENGVNRNTLANMIPDSFVFPKFGDE